MPADKSEAQKRADARFNIGVDAENKLLEQISNMVIRDRLVHPSAMTFDQFAENNHSELVLFYKGNEEPYKIHRHALGQLAAKVELPIIYLNRLNIEGWRRMLLCENLNTLFAKTEFKDRDTTRFLHRIVGNEIRAFLSRRFNRHLSSLPLVRAFVEAVHAATAKPVEASMTDLRWSLKCYLPRVFEAFPGQYICVGVTQSHSDFGAGKHVISQSVWDPMRDTRTVLEGVSKVHLGSVIEDSDIEMSDETAVKEVEAQAEATRDAVTQYLGEEHINKALKAVRVAQEENIPWGELKAALAKVLYDKEIAGVETLLNSPDIVDLPPVGRTAAGDPLPTRWWASTMLSKLANSQDDERKMELQSMAGKWLGT